MTRVELSYETLSAAQLAQVYNAVAEQTGRKAVRKFTNHEVALTRTTEAVIAGGMSLLDALRAAGLATDRDAEDVVETAVEDAVQAGAAPAVEAIPSDIRRQEDEAAYTEAVEFGQVGALDACTSRTADAGMPEALPQTETAAVEVEVVAEPVAAPVASLPYIPVAGRRFILCIEGDSFPQTSPEAWAIEFARRTGKPVVIRDAATFEVLGTRSPVTKAERRAAERARRQEQAPRAVKTQADKTAAAPVAPVVCGPRPEGRVAPALAKPRAPSARTAQAIALAVRPDGVTRKELDALSDKVQPWTQTLKDCWRFGYVFSVEKTANGTAIYRLRRADAEASEAAA